VNPFQKLDPDKQQAILQAALSEFAEKGYEQASTNRIVKQAGIGKGMLFYYFNSKRELYHYLVRYCLDLIEKEYLGQLDLTMDDMLDWLAHLSQKKFEFFIHYPEASLFLANLVLREQEMLLPDLREKLDGLIQKGHELTTLDRFNRGRFRGDIDPDKALHLIQWTLKGYQQDFMERYRGRKVDSEELKPMWDDFAEYLDILKTCYYSESRGD